MSASYLPLTALLLAGCAVSSEAPKWTTDEEVIHKNHIKVLNVAKQSQRELIREHNGEVDFDYWIESLNGGWVVKINPMYRVSETESIVYMSAAECVYVNNQFKLVKVIRCDRTHTPPF